jgi:hypothetical protein
MGLPAPPDTNPAIRIDTPRRVIKYQKVKGYKNGIILTAW